MFGEVFVLLFNNEGIKYIFIGELYRKVLVFSNDFVVNGFFEILGKIIFYSLKVVLVFFICYYLFIGIL